MYAVYYGSRKLSPAGTEHEATLDLIRLQPLFQNIEVRPCHEDDEQAPRKEGQPRPRSERVAATTSS